MIDWGDGSFSESGTVRQVDTGQFAVAGTHTYARPGIYTARVSASVDDGRNVGTNVIVRIAGGDYRLAGQNLLAIEGFHTPVQKLASFTLAPGTTLAQYSATVRWGDGGVSPAQIGSSLDGRPIVTGAHTYARAGIYVMNVVLRGPHGGLAECFATAQVANAALVARPRQVLVKPGKSFNAAVFSFIDTNPLARASDYVAYIEWGDGNADTGVVRAGPQGRFDIFGKHTYAQRGLYEVTVHIYDNTIGSDMGDYLRGTGRVIVT